MTSWINVCSTEYSNLSNSVWNKAIL